MSKNISVEDASIYRHKSTLGLLFILGGPPRRLFWKFFEVFLKGQNITRTTHGSPSNYKYKTCQTDGLLVSFLSWDSHNTV